MSAPEVRFADSLAPEERELLAELLEAERHRLLLEIRHSAHRRFRDDLKARYDRVERLSSMVRREEARA